MTAYLEFDLDQDDANADDECWDEVSKQAAHVAAFSCRFYAIFSTRYADMFKR